MAADQMAAELVADSEGALEVDAASRAPLPKRRHRQRLGAHVEGDRRTARVQLDTDHSEAGPGIADRGPDGNRSRVVGAGDPEASQVPAGVISIIWPTSLIIPVNIQSLTQASHHENSIAPGAPFPTRATVLTWNKFEPIFFAGKPQKLISKPAFQIDVRHHSPSRALTATLSHGNRNCPHFVWRTTIRPRGCIGSTSMSRSAISFAKNE